MDAQLAGHCALRDFKLNHLVNGAYTFVRYGAGRHGWGWAVLHGFAPGAASILLIIAVMISLSGV